MNRQKAKELLKNGCREIDSRSEANQALTDQIQKLEAENARLKIALSAFNEPHCNYIPALLPR